ncbi:MAG: protein-L-isoaspartate O-methyltransferase, partial [Planctomycetota bacterium]
AAEEVPRDLLSQLDPSGRMVIPIGPADGPQELRVYQRLDRQRFAVAILGEVRFVPLAGE